MNIVVLIPSMTNLVFVDLLAGIHDVLHPPGYQEVIGITRCSSAEALLGSYLEFQPDGLLITGVDHPPSGRRRLEAFGRTVVDTMLLELLDGTEPAARRVDLDFELKIRESS